MAVISVETETVAVTGVDVSELPCGGACGQAKLYVREAPAAHSGGSAVAVRAHQFAHPQGQSLSAPARPRLLLSGITASRAALEDTGSADVPNDTYTRDETHKLLTFLVPARALVTVLTHATCSTPATVAKLAKSVTRSRRF